MTGTVLGFFLVGLAASLAELLLPNDGERGTKTAFRVLVSLAVLLLVLKPLLGLFQELPSLEISGDEPEGEQTYFQEIFENTVNAQGAADFKEGLYRLLEAEYGISRENVRIYLHFSENGELTLVELYLSGQAWLREPEQIKAELTERLHCETEVR